ncbi:hypothetical protein FB451DRAFT_1179798 [Mycena latifolia]|nr:hypothetical protein FB451DRAFT_1179798 [Mycena latifolia]
MQMLPRMDEGGRGYPVNHSKMMLSAHLWVGLAVNQWLWGGRSFRADRVQLKLPGPSEAPWRDWISTRWGWHDVQLEYLAVASPLKRVAERPTPGPCFMELSENSALAPDSRPLDRKSSYFQPSHYKQRRALVELPGEPQILTCKMANRGKAWILDVPVEITPQTKQCEVSNQAAVLHGVFKPKTSLMVGQHSNPEIRTVDQAEPQEHGYNKFGGLEGPAVLDPDNEYGDSSAFTVNFAAIVGLSGVILIVQKGLFLDERLQVFVEGHYPLLLHGRLDEYFSLCNAVYPSIPLGLREPIKGGIGCIKFRPTLPGLLSFEINSDRAVFSLVRIYKESPGPRIIGLEA